MVNQYRDQLAMLLEQVRPQLAIEHQLEFKNLFGAVAGYVGGRIFISCGKFGVALRLPADVLADLFKEPDVERLRYFHKGHVKKEYAVVPMRIIGDHQYWSKLIDESVNYVGRLDHNIL